MPAKGWLDVTSDTVIIKNANGVYCGRLPTIPRVEYFDTNGNGRFDGDRNPTEPVWQINTESSAFDPSTSTPLNGFSSTLGLSSSGNQVYYIPSGTSGNPGAYYRASDGSYDDGLFTDLTQISGTSGEYLFYDVNGNGKWDEGDSIWQDNGDGVHGAGDTDYYTPSGSIAAGLIGKSNGLYCGTVTGRSIVWADQNSAWAEPRTFQQDVANLYAGLDALNWRPGADVVAAATDRPLTATGTATVSNGTVTGTGTSFSSELKDYDWVKIGDSPWYQVDDTDITDETFDFDGNSDSTSTFSGTILYAGWTLIPEVTQPETDTGLTFHYQRGRPDATSPLFQSNFQELQDALGALAAALGVTVSLTAAPTLTLAHSTEMDLRNVVPDSNLDGIVHTSVDLSSFGSDTGVMAFDPTRGPAQVYIPINEDTSGPVSINSYLVQGAFRPSDSDTLSLTSTLWKYPDVGEQGLSWGYSLDERVDINFFISTSANHLLRMTVTRPGGNAVTFDFPWDSDSQRFSEWGYPVGSRDGRRTYVLHAMPIADIYTGYSSLFRDTNVPAINYAHCNGPSDVPAFFELRFDDGTVHRFDEEGFLCGIQVADGRCIDLSGHLACDKGGLGSSNSGYGYNGHSLTSNGLAGMGTLTPGSGTVTTDKYNITLNYSQGYLANVSYRSRLNGSDVITTTLDYLPDSSLIDGLAKYGPTLNAPMPEYSYTLDGGSSGSLTAAVIATNGGTNTITRSVTGGAVTLTYHNSGQSTNDSSSNSYVLNSDGRVTSLTHSLQTPEGTSAGTITYTYATGNGRYASNGAPQWGKITRVDYPTGFWEAYQYDPVTGWATQYTRPFKDTQEAGSGPVVTQTYTYDTSKSGGGTAANLFNIVEMPREVVSRIADTVVGVTFLRYDYFEGSTDITAHSGVFATLSESQLADYTWDDALNATRSTLGLGGHIPSMSFSALGGTYYVVTGPNSDGTWTITGETHGPSMDFAGETLSTFSYKMTAFGTIVAGTSSDCDNNVIISNFSCSYDGFGRILVTHDYVTGQNSTASYTNNGDVSWWGPISETSSSGIVTQYTYNSMGLVASVASGSLTTSFTYDADGNTVAMTKVAGGRTITLSQAFDALGRMTRYTDELGHTTSYTYSVSSGVLTIHSSTVATGSTGEHGTLDRETYIDGHAKKISGTTMDTVTYDEGVDPLMGYWDRTIANSDTGDLAAGQVTTTYYNSLNLAYHTETSGPNPDVPLCTNIQYDGFGRQTEVDDDATGSVSNTVYNPDNGRAVTSQGTVNGAPTRSDSESTVVSGTVSLGTLTGATFRYGGDDYDFVCSIAHNATVSPGVSVSASMQNDDPTTASVSATTVDGLESWTIADNQTTRTWTVVNPNDASIWTTYTAYPDGTTSEDSYTDARLSQSWTHPTGSSATLSLTSYEYDGFGQQQSVTTLSGGTLVTTRYEYLDNGQVDRVYYNVPTGQTTSSDYQQYTYDAVTGQAIATRQRDGSTLTLTVNPKGEIRERSGGGAPGVTMANNATAGISTLTTYIYAGAATTTWQVDPRTGLLLSKTYADNSSDSYTYNSHGQLASVSRPDGVTATYGYTADGIQNSISYAQTGASTIRYSTLSFDLFGNPLEIQENVGGTLTQDLFTYDSQERKTSETANYAGGNNSHYGLTWDYGTTGATAGKLGHTYVKQSNNTLTTTTYGYDTAGQLNSVTGESGTVTSTTTIDYVPGLQAQGTLTTSSAAGDIVTTKQYNAATGYLEDVTTVQGSVTISQIHYGYPGPSYAHADQVEFKQVTLTPVGGTVTTSYFEVYTYDSQNQLTGLWRYDGVYYEGYYTPAYVISHFTPTFNEEYSYDGVGNRATCSVNGVNETISAGITNAYGTEDIPNVVLHEHGYNGRGDLTSVVNGYYAYFGEYQMAATYDYDALDRLTGACIYSNDPSSLLVNFSGALAGSLGLSGTHTLTRYFSGGDQYQLHFVWTDGQYTAMVWRPDRSLTPWQLALYANTDLSTPLYATDLDLADGWGNTAGFNTTVALADGLTGTLADLGATKAEYTYDAQNRRTSETLFTIDAATGLWTSTPQITQYVYDGWNLAAEIDGATGQLTKSYTWDPTAATGGLLCITTYQNGVATGRYKPVYDGNANVVALLDLNATDSSQSIVATYTYSAFGQCTAAGTQAGVCLFRFGGMYWQAGTHTYYDKHRDYDPVQGRFIERDPIGENGGVNLYAYCNNDPINHTDPPRSNYHHQRSHN